MKSRFTSVIMFLIIITIMVAMFLLGYITYNQLSKRFNSDTSETVEQAELFKTTETETETEIPDTIEKNIEVPKVRSASNPLTELEQSNKNNSKDTDVNYDNITVNKYFYNQLNQYSQNMYKALESNKENMKSGNYRINLGSTFTDVLSNSNGQEILGDYYQSAIEAYIYDNPDVFYLNPSKMYLNIETTTRGSKKTYNTFIDCGEDGNYFIDEFSSKAEVENAIQKLEYIKNRIVSQKTSNTYNNIKMVHDYLVDNISYDSSVSKGNIYNIYGALVNNECVCEGYAKSFKYLLDGLGIESTIVIGKATNSSGISENHAWNYVRVGNNWYAIDCTWDDPIIIGGGYAGSDIKYKYFLKGSSTMNLDHFPSGSFTERGITFEYPSLSNSAY